MTKKSKAIEEKFKNNIPKLVDYYFDIIFCKFELTDDFEKSEKQQIIDAYEKHLHRFPVFTQRIRINTPRDVITQLRRGKIDLNMAKEFMAVFKNEFEIVELPKMMEKLEEITQSKT